MRLIMVSGDRQVSVGEKGPFHAMQREFSRYFDRIDVLCPRPPVAPSVFSIHGNVHFHPADCSRFAMVAYIENKGRELLAEHGHQLIVSHDYGWFYNGFGSARLSRASGVPYVSEIHHVPGVPLATNLRESFDRLVARYYISWARDRAKAFRVVNREEMPNLLRRWKVPLSKILVLPSLYIDLDVFKPVPTEVEYDIVFVGRMVSNKGVRKIIEAMRLLAAEGMPLRACFVGKGPLRERLQQDALRAGLGERIEFIEWVELPADLANIYRRSRVCVCASTCEGGPRFTVEAMACGVPVVSTPVGVMSDLLADGSAGALTSFDLHSLKKSLRAVLEDEDRRLAMGQAAHAAAQPFEYARAIATYANGLRLLAGVPEAVL